MLVSLSFSLQSTDLHVLKCHIMRFLTSNIFDDNELLLPCVIAACDLHHSVVALGQDSLKNLRRLDLEDAALVPRLLAAWQGQEAPKGAASTPPAFRRAVGEPVRLRLLAFLSRSTLAANSFPATLRVIFECLFADPLTVSTPKLQTAGLAFAAFVCAKAAPTQLTLPMAKIIFPSLLKLLVTSIKAAEAAALAAASPAPPASATVNLAALLGGTAPPANAAQQSAQQVQQRLLLRGAMFSVLAQLVARQPALAHGNVCTQLARLYFSTLAQLGVDKSGGGGQSNAQHEADEILRSSACVSLCEIVK